MQEAFIKKIRLLIHFLYHFVPCKKRIPECIFTYALCGGANVLLNWILYFVLYNFIIKHRFLYINVNPIYNYTLCISPHILSLIIVFPITIFTGFWLNKYISFPNSAIQTRKQLIRYITIIFINLLIILI